MFDNAYYWMMQLQFSKNQRLVDAMIPPEKTNSFGMTGDTLKEFRKTMRKEYKQGRIQYAAASAVRNPEAP